MKNLITIDITKIFRYVDGELYYLDSFGKISHNASYLDNHNRKVISRIPGNKYQGRILSASLVWYYFNKEFINCFDYVDQNPYNIDINNILPNSSLNRKYKIANTQSSSTGIKYVTKRITKKSKKVRYDFYKYIFDNDGNMLRVTNITYDNLDDARKASEEQINFLKKNQWRK